MASPDGRNARTPYRVRVGDTWYWVDPTVPAHVLEAGDIVVIHSVSGPAHVAVLQEKFDPPREAHFATLEGERFSLPAADIAALHLAAVDAAP